MGLDLMKQHKFAMGTRKRCQEVCKSLNHKKTLDISLPRRRLKQTSTLKETMKKFDKTAHASGNCIWFNNDFGEGISPVSCFVEVDTN